MEYWDGKGNSWYDEFDATGAFSSGWYSQTSTYNVSANCVALDYYNPGVGYLYFLNPDGSGINWINGEVPTFANSHNLFIEQGIFSRVTSVGLPLAVLTKPACNARTLLGTYASTAFEYSNGLTYARLSRRSFDGKGSFTYREDAVTAGALPSRQSGTGAYTVSDNCRIALFYDGQTNAHYAGLASPDGGAFWWVNSQAIGTVSAGKSQRVSLASVDNSASLP